MDGFINQESTLYIYIYIYQQFQGGGYWRLGVSIILNAIQETNPKHQSTTHPRKTQSDGRQRVEQKGKDFPKRGLLAKPCWPPDFHSMYWPSAVHGFLSAICSLPFWALESSCPTTIDTLRRAQPHPGLFVPQQDPISFWPAIAVPLRLEAGSKCAAIAPSP